MAASGTKVFEKLFGNPPGKNKLVSKHGLFRLLRSVLGKIAFSGEGVNVSVEEEGRVHFDVLSALLAARARFGLDHPFMATPGEGGLTIRPGMVYSVNAGAGGAWHAPTINGQPITDVPAPLLAVAGGSYTVALVAKFGTDGAAKTPFAIQVFSRLPDDTPVVRDNSAVAHGQPQEGVYHIPLYSRDANGGYQWVKTNITVNLDWENVYIMG